MPDVSPRPAHLPDYRNPPLDEVVLGVQFAPARGYQQIRAGEVWNLYKADFPVVEEHPPVPPTFETFGISGVPPTLNVGVVVGPQHDRFWFLSSEKSQLIQFQEDRLLHNWRKVGDRTNEYPRFETMILSFENELRCLEAYFNELAPQKLTCNQAEISYVNQIPFGPSGKVSEWLRFLDFGVNEPDDVSSIFRRAIMGPTGIPIGRLTCQLNTAGNRHGERKLILSFTVRGAPADATISGALDFLKLGREAIVMEFTARTSDSAHEFWERIP